MKQLIHNGVLVPKPYEAKGFHVYYKGRKLELSSHQEEMAYAWVKKLGTEYVKDRIFVKNFFRDFCVALNIEEEAKPEDFVFSEIRKYVEREAEKKLRLTKEEKKQIAQARKGEREKNKEIYGYVIVDGVKTEVSNYVAEPPSIFMGRGKHPLRGMWKHGAGKEDIVLNLSPDTPVPKGNWKEVVWQPDCMWVAKWNDKLSGKTKYVWLADSSNIKQEKEKEKFSKARKLEREIDEVRREIWDSLRAKDEKRRKIATICYLIDELKLRVGDEKDEDEADTVGATTLEPRHISINSNGHVTFDFIGKDYVKWRKEVDLPEAVVDNLREYASIAKSSMFEGVRSEDVNAFLNEAMPGLTAKVFRTYHASKAVRDYLESAKVRKSTPEFGKKYVAKMANLEAAVACNHKRKIPKRWTESLKSKEERVRVLETQIRLKKTEKSKKRAREALKKAKLNVKLMKSTKEYNLGTSLKSYIDPRVYYDWGRKVDFDWRLYYPKTLQKKFSWLEEKG